MTNSNARSDAFEGDSTSKPNGGEYFLSCDWGSTSFRLRLVSKTDGMIAGEVQTGRGATVLSNEIPPDAPKAAKEKLFADCMSTGIDELAGSTAVDLNDITVVISGMATSAHGWRELPYSRPPFPVDGSGIIHHKQRMDGRHLIFLSGLSADDDVMRGEESEIIGLFSLDEWRPFAEGCVLVMPGTHSKHVFIEDGAITGFRTYMTGEMFGALSAHSVLRKTVEGGTPSNAEAFGAGVRFAMDNGVAGGLFKVRSYGLLGRYDANGCASFLSGLLIGAETASLSGYLEGRSVILCAAGKFLHQYESALLDAGFGKAIKIVPQDTVGTLSALGHRRILTTLKI